MRLKLLPFIVLTLAIAFTAGDSYAKKKPVMGVDEFRNDTHAGWWRSGVGSELAGMLTNELGSMGAFKMVERKKIESVLREQDLGASGRVRKGTAAKIGNLTGAQYLVMATVSAYEEDTSTRGGGISFGGISLGGSKQKAYIAVDLRVVNTTTGDVDFIRTVDVHPIVDRFSFGGGVLMYLGGSKALRFHSPHLVNFEVVSESTIPRGGNPCVSHVLAAAIKGSCHTENRA